MKNKGRVQHAHAAHSVLSTSCLIPKTMRFVESTKFLAALPRRMSKIAALDVGTKHIGVAMCDESRTATTPCATLRREAQMRMSDGSIGMLSKKIQTLIEDESFDGLVVGVPLQEGKPGPFAEEIVQLMLRMPCYYPPLVDKKEMIFTLWNEHSSTVDARRASAVLGASKAAFKRHKDEMAAAVVLRSFLDFNHLVPPVSPLQHK